MTELALQPSLFAGGKPLGRRADKVEDYAHATFGLETGAAVQLACSWRLQAGCDAIISVSFYGTEGGAAFRNVSGSFYDFVAEPFGTHLYHCHSLPLAQHIHRGLYGAMIIDPRKGRPDAHFAGLISSIALGGMIIALLQWRYGPDTRRFPAGTFPSGQLEVFGARFTVLQAAILVISVVLRGALTWLVARSRLGRAMRAVAENPTAARVLGVDVDRVTATTFAISAALGAVAGALFAMNVNSAQLGMGSAIELKGLAVIIVGGMGSLPGALVGGLLLGVAEVLAVQYIGSSWRDLVAFALLFGLLVLRPQGIFGSRRLREV
jgi:branched-chain amino acid transport system permease protein